ncbi:MAG: competence/damage-inducible protein A, partial [Candidatus Cloacimonetes bacterium]|nr:competence/damage-inducible protein A [Candidatus Cloacimonadota bacterium]
MKAAVLTIGNEILIGRTVNTNLTFLAKELTSIGIDVDFSATIKDVKNEIFEMLTYCDNRFDLIITTGGLGPTSDDITKSVIAEFYQKKLIFSPKIWEDIKKLFEKRNIEIPAINRNQAEVPEDFTVLENRYGTAPGLLYENKKNLFFALPGVP